MKVNMTLEKRFNEMNLLRKKNCENDESRNCDSVADEVRGDIDDGSSKQKRQVGSSAKSQRPKVQALKQTNLTKKQDDAYFILQSQLKIPVNFSFLA
jgi:hypothetical protein